MVSYRIFENQVKNSKIIFINTYILWENVSIYNMLFKSSLHNLTAVHMHNTIWILDTREQYVRL